MSAGTRMGAACACVVLAHAARPARAESMVFELGRKAYAAVNAAEAHEDQIREKYREVQERAEDFFAATDLLLASEPIDSAGVEVTASAGGGYDVSRPTSEASAELIAYLGSASCRTVWASLLVRGRTATDIDDRARAGGAAAAGVCFPKGIYLSNMFELPITMSAFPLRIEGRAALLKTPALTAARSALREPYSETGWSVAMEGMRFLRGKEPGIQRRRWIAAPGVSVTQNWQWRGYPTGDPARLEVSADIWFVRVHRERPPLALADRSIDVFAIGLHGVRDENGAAVVDFWPLRISGLGLGTDRVLVDASVGFSGLGTINADGEEIPTTGLPQVDIVAAHAALHIGTQRGSLSLGFDSTLDTNLLAELVYESRGYVSGRGGAGRLWIDAGAFGGRAIHYLDLTTQGEERFVGLSLDGTYTIAKHVAAGVSIAATHTLHRDATLTEDRVPRDGVRALLTLTATHALYKSE
ncbi:MAG TPA: hypothetical protein VNO30_22525, partial [Kofleriaceae bacterium]|nr:hypothetical protein [Kofleriaceae bacterium]